VTSSGNAAGFRLASVTPNGAPYFLDPLEGYTEAMPGRKARFQAKVHPGEVTRDEVQLTHPFRRLLSAMATRAETSTVYAAGGAQGIVLVTFPAASTIFTNPDEYGLSNTQYGVLFLPQVATAITASLLGAAIGRRTGTKNVYLAGLASGLVSMLLLLLSASFESGSAAFPVLLLATAFLGAGFGLTVPTLNVLTAAFHPAAVESSVLVLNALLGLGTALAPVFVAAFVGLGFWWGLPLTSAILLTLLLVVSLGLPLRTEVRPGAAARSTAGIPRRFWIYGAFAVLYGICETVNGNWSQLDMTSKLGATTTEAAVALTAFWAMVTVGRVLFAAVERWLAARTTYHVLPFVLAATFVVIALLPAGATSSGIIAFGVAGLGCSALLPLTIGFGQEELAGMAAAMAGGVIAFYQLGYGIAAFGVGPLLDGGVTLSTVYGASAVVAVVMGLVSFAVAHPAGAEKGAGRPVSP
jgi:fucose permease